MPFRAQRQRGGIVDSVTDLSRKIEDYLHFHIPLSRNMQVSVCAIGEDGVRLAAPLQPNINHRGTVFGGSVSALAMIAGWTLVYVRVRDLAYDTRLVIRRNSVDYFAPLPGDFRAWARARDADGWSTFFDGLESRGKGRLHVIAEISSNTEVAARFEGEYVALRES